MSKEISIQQFIRAIKKLSPDKRQNYPGKWYKSQKEHWLGWLSQYDGPGAYSRRASTRRNAKLAYNRIVEYRMLLWLIKAAGVNAKLVQSAQSAANRKKTLQEKSAAIRHNVPWEEVRKILWGENEGRGRSDHVQNSAFSVRQPFAAMIMSGVKRIEYRSRSTSKRGRFYVYASKDPDWERYEHYGLQPDDLPRGFLIGTVEIVDCSAKSGKYRWYLANPRPLKRPKKPQNRPMPTWFTPFKKQAN
jgi:hypothetical protein